MTVRADGAVLHLEGECPIEDAEALMEALLASPRPVVDWSRCEAAHTAVVQVLIVAKPTLRGPPAGSFLQQWVAPALSGGQT